jgi:hypothetical protein
MDLTFMQALTGSGSSGPAMLGIGAGLALAIVEYAVLSQAGVRAADRGDARGRRILFWIAASGFVINPFIGYLIGSFL